ARPAGQDARERGQSAYLRPESEAPARSWCADGCARSDSGEARDDLLSQHMQRLQVIGESWDVEQNIVRPGIDHGLDALRQLIGRADHGPLGILGVATPPYPAGPLGGLLGVLSRLEGDRPLQGRRADDRVVAASDLVAVPLEDLQLVPDGVR